ncbi:hypothetical protein [Smaragdicoccus niigatensis]|uniref:hypothetical protein n=1 Tax=Smaragdicoccus niigatensis TaxID=359359 RepID=UPI00039EA71A|nr:hypothetical protein [Smaragdicoccus niigatensis]
MKDPFATLYGLALCAGLTYLVVTLVRSNRTVESATNVRDATSFWRFNPPPGWPPAPVRFVPEAGWRPDPALPIAPIGWRWWVPAGPADGVTTIVAATAWVPAFADRAAR